MASFALMIASCSTSEPRQQTAPTLSTSTTAATVDTSTPSTSSSLGTSATTGDGQPEVLVFSKTAGFRHDSIEAGVEALTGVGDEWGFSVTATEDSEIFTSARLAAFRVVVFLNTTGDVLDEAQQGALEAFVSAGNGFVGVHSAADTEYDWPWYGGLVAAYFERHPKPQAAVVEVLAPEHPVTLGLPTRFERFDEWYDYRTVPPPNVTILATLDESSYEGGSMGDLHPIMWAHEYEGGRAVYTGFGHTVESFAEPVVRTLLANAVLWAAGSPGELATGA